MVSEDTRSFVTGQSVLVLLSNARNSMLVLHFLVSIAEHGGKRKHSISSCFTGQKVKSQRTDTEDESDCCRLFCTATALSPRDGCKSLGCFFLVFVIAKQHGKQSDYNNNQSSIHLRFSKAYKPNFRNDVEREVMNADWIDLR